MLRITRVEDDKKSLHLRLEGRIVGDWVQLLEQELAQASASSRHLVLDLAGVTFANDAALAILHRALNGGASLFACSPLLAALLGRPPDGS